MTIPATALLATGYEQARSMVAALAGDWDAARNVQLKLPETGVCNSNLAVDGEDTVGCCGSTPAEDTKRGLATGVSDGPLALPLITVTASDTAGNGGCCS